MRAGAFGLGTGAGMMVHRRPFPDYQSTEKVTGPGEPRPTPGGCGLRPTVLVWSTTDAEVEVSAAAEEVSAVFWLDGSQGGLEVGTPS